MLNNEIQDREEIDLLDYLMVVLKRKKIIMGITFSVSAITVVISLAMTPIYRARTTIISPESSTSMAAQFMGQFDNAASALLGGFDVKTPGDLYVGMLRSRTIYDRIIDRFNLMELYRSKNREMARLSLSKALKTEVDNKSGLLTIEVEDKDPKMAADLANGFVDELKAMRKEIATAEVSQRKQFFEEQLKAAEAELIEAEESMKLFQEKTGAIKIDAQTKAVLEGIAQLRARIAAKEVQLKVMGTYATRQNPDIRRTEEELRGLRQQLDKLEVREGTHNPYSLVPTGSIPSVGTEYGRKLRDFKYRETLYSLLLKQYETARFEESLDVPVIQVIDEAVPPEIRVRPKRKKMVVAATFTAFFFSVLAAFFVDYARRLLEGSKADGRYELLKKHVSPRSG